MPFRESIILKLMKFVAICGKIPCSVAIMACFFLTATKRLTDTFSITCSLLFPLIISLDYLTLFWIVPHCSHTSMQSLDLIISWATKDLTCALMKHDLHCKCKIGLLIMSLSDMIQRVNHSFVNAVRVCWVASMMLTCSPNQFQKK